MSLGRTPLVAILTVALTLLAPHAPAEPPAPPAPPASPAPAAPPAAPAAPEAAFAMPDTPAGRAMTRVLDWLNGEGDELGAESFAPGFLAQVPYEQVRLVAEQLRAQCGRLTPVKVEKAAGERELVVRAKPAKLDRPWQVILELDGEDKIQTLLLRPAPGGEPALTDWADLDRRLSALPGRTSFAAYRLVAPAAEADRPAGPYTLEAVHTLRADDRLAIGSTFKLYVLGALAEAVEKGEVRWDEKLAIKAAHKSLPSGKMQDEPVGAEFPVSRFADLMISISDNTATDHLLHRLGRERVEAFMATVHGRPELNTPFLTTRELFTLRLSGDATLVPRWLKADAGVRRDMLLADDPARPTRPLGPSHNPGEIAAWIPSLQAAESWTTPRNIDTIEWFASAEECGRVMADLARRERGAGMDPLGHALRINPGLDLSGQRWTKVAFKGGSEPGVMNLTYLLTRDDGRLYAASMGWNDPERPVDEGKMAGLMTRALQLLSGGE